MKSENFWKKCFFALSIMIVFWEYSADFAFGQVQQYIEIPSSFNPVGSGARAIGMGGAFIAVADDATAASWNPGGLIQLEKPEISLVTSFLQRSEDIQFGTDPEGSGEYSISDENINYFSVAYPFQLSNRNMIISLSYQHLFDFNREWRFTLKENEDFLSYEDNVDYQQQGRLSALGLSYCIQITPQLSAGFTLNLWKDGLTDNRWKQKYHITGSGMIDGIIPFSEEFDMVYEYSFTGFNANFGILWNIKNFTLGAVLKTPFRADVEYKADKESSLTDSESQYKTGEYETRDEEIKMPMSYGIGLACRLSDNFSVSADIYRTEWDDFIYKESNGQETSAVSGNPVNESDIDPTHQVRAGAEYLFINKNKGYVIPLRCGIFYDPAPAENNPDDFYGFSLGFGFTKPDWFSLDIAYQYRFGNDVGKSLFQDWQFSEDVKENIVYLSMIWYKFK